MGAKQYIGGDRNTYLHRIKVTFWRLPDSQIFNCYLSTKKKVTLCFVLALLHIQHAELLTVDFTGGRYRKNKQLPCCNHVELLTCSHMTYSSTDNRRETSQQTFLSRQPRRGVSDLLTSRTFQPTAVNHGAQCWSGLLCVFGQLIARRINRSDWEVM